MLNLGIAQRLLDSALDQSENNTKAADNFAEGFFRILRKQTGPGGVVLLDAALPSSAIFRQLQENVVGLTEESARLRDRLFDAQETICSQQETICSLRAQTSDRRQKAKPLPRSPLPLAKPVTKPQNPVSYRALPERYLVILEILVLGRNSAAKNLIYKCYNEYFNIDIAKETERRLPLPYAHPLETELPQLRTARRFGVSLIMQDRRGNASTFTILLNGIELHQQQRDKINSIRIAQIFRKYAGTKQ